MIVRPLPLLALLWVSTWLYALPSFATPSTRSAAPPAAATRPTAPKAQAPPTSRAVVAPRTSASSRPHKATRRQAKAPTARTSATPPRPATSPRERIEGAAHLRRDRRTRRPRRPRFTSISRTSFFWTQVIGMLVALAVIVLLIYVSLRWAAARMGLQTQTHMKMLRVIDRLSMEPKKGLWIVEAADEYLLLATHDQGVTLIKELDTATVKAYLEPKEAPTGGFWERLRWSATGRSDESRDTKAQAEAEATVPKEFEVVSDGKSSTTETP